MILTSFLGSLNKDKNSFLVDLSYLDLNKLKSEGQTDNLREKILDIYEDRLKDKSFLFGATISLADVAIMPFIRQFSNVDIGFFNNRFTFLSKWKQSLISLEIFSKMMNKFEVWEDDEKGESILFT